MASGSSQKKPTPRKPTARAASHNRIGARASARMSAPSSRTVSPLRGGFFHRSKSSASSTASASLRMDFRSAAAKPTAKPTPSLAPSPAVVAQAEARRAQRRRGALSQTQRAQTFFGGIAAIAAALVTSILHTLAAHKLRCFAWLGVGCVVCAALVWLSLRFLPIFPIEHVEAPATDHLSSQDISQLAHIEQGTTLFNIDETAIEARVKKSPWVARVQFQRTFPNTITLQVTESRIDCVVSIGTSTTAWYMSEGGTWIEPVTLPSDDSISLKEKVMQKAKELGAIAICDLPDTVQPAAASAATDETIAIIQEYRHKLSSEFLDDVVAFSAPTPESCALTLSSGVEVSLGRPSQIAEKERIIRALIAKHPGKLTYINVRTVQKPSYRMVNSENLQPGTGV